jgi:hypothetical protein
MLAALIVVGYVLWLLGVVSSYTLGGFIQVLLVPALVGLLRRLSFGNLRGVNRMTEIVDALIPYGLPGVLLLVATVVVLKLIEKGFLVVVGPRRKRS